MTPPDRRSCPTCALLEAELAEVRNQLIVLERLHGGHDRAGVLEAIQDLVINVVGSEELAVFEPDRAGALRPVQAFGLEPGRLASAGRWEGPIARAVSERRAWIAGDGPDVGDAALTAVVPLEARGRVVAVLAVWRMLAHKPVLGEVDRRVLELLSRHAGRALAAATQEAAE